MGWEMMHMYEFAINGDLYGGIEAAGDDSDNQPDATRTRISSGFSESDERMRFHDTYDFGDDWLHVVLFEGVVEAESGTEYPQCVDGRNDCPPEDIGDTFHFHFLQQARRSRCHEAYEEARRMRNAMDRNRISPERATKAMWKNL